MNDLPDPLTPPECDLRGMPYMPLDIVRLFDSDLYALSTGDEFKAALSLWGKAFLQRPGGSLPNDERILAHLSGAGSRWPEVRDMALRGWVRCSDGRLYHPTVAEKAREAWEARLARRERTAAARAARLAAKANSDTEPPSSVTESVTENATSDVTEVVTGSKGREGKGREDKKERTRDKSLDAAGASGSEAPSDLEPQEARPPPDAKAMLWSHGLPIVRRLTGKTDPQARRLLGKWLKTLEDDCATLGRILIEAADAGPVDPVPWITAAVERQKRPKYRNGFLQMIADEGMDAAPRDPVTAFLEGPSDAWH